MFKGCVGKNRDDFRLNHLVWQTGKWQTEKCSKLPQWNPPLRAQKPSNQALCRELSRAVVVEIGGSHPLFIARVPRGRVNNADPPQMPFQPIGRNRSCCRSICTVQEFVVTGSMVLYFNASMYSCRQFKICTAIRTEVPNRETWPFTTMLSCQIILPPSNQLPSPVSALPSRCTPICSPSSPFCMGWALSSSPSPNPQQQLNSK